MTTNAPLVTDDAGPWFYWFAWRPVRLAGDSWEWKLAWLRKLKRRRMTMHFTYETDPDVDNHSHSYWEYRAL